MFQSLELFHCLAHVIIVNLSTFSNMVGQKYKTRYTGSFLKLEDFFGPYATGVDCGEDKNSLWRHFIPFGMQTRMS